jgi:parvulin-like peptidyl-prolyl isomerase
MGLIVNGEPVDDALVQQEFEAVKSYESSRTHVSCCEKDAEFREKALENVISRVVLLQEAEKTTEALTDRELDDAVRALKESHGGEEKFYQAFNITAEQESEVRRDVEANLRIEKMLLQAAAPETEPDGAELEAHYRANLDRYKTPEQVRFAHIVRSPGREERAEAYAGLREVREKLLAGGDVEALWKEHSDSAKQPDAQGADLGWVGLNEVLPELEAVAFSLRVGEVSPVFSSMYGYHLVKVAERRPAVPRPLDEVRAEVREAFIQERRRSRVKAFMDGLRARAVVERPQAAASS